MPGTSSQLTKQVRRALSEDSRTDDAPIDLVDNNGVITLTGTVSSEKVRQAAQEIVSEEQGVVSVINDLEVETEGFEPPIVVPPMEPQ